MGRCPAADRDRAFQPFQRLGDPHAAAHPSPGLGLALAWHGAGFTGSGQVQLARVGGVALGGYGQARVLPAPTEMGQGTKTIFPQLAGEALGIAPEQVELGPQDTSIVPNSGPTVASRTTMVVGGLVLKAARRLREQVQAAAQEATIIVKAAAVADYRPRQRAAEKIKKGEEAALSLELEKNPDILAELGKGKGDRLLVGFAAETGDLIANARQKLTSKHLDLIVANDVTQEGAGFDADTNIVRFLYPDGRVEDLPKLAKLEVANRLLDRLAAMRREAKKG